MSHKLNDIPIVIYPKADGEVSIAGDCVIHNVPQEAQSKVCVPPEGSSRDVKSNGPSSAQEKAALPHDNITINQNDNSQKLELQDVSLEMNETQAPESPFSNMYCCIYRKIFKWIKSCKLCFSLFVILGIIPVVLMWFFSSNIKYYRYERHSDDLVNTIIDSNDTDFDHVNATEVMFTEIPNLTSLIDNDYDI